MDPLLALIAGYILGAALGFLAGVEAHAQTAGKDMLEGVRDIWHTHPQKTDSREGEE